MAEQLNNRLYKFDNIKFVAILFVVIGHFIEGFTDKSDMFKSLFVFIYAFHMPLFIFLSGLFQKRFSDQNRLKINKIAFYVLLGTVLKIMSAAAKTAYGKKFSLNFFGGSSIDWFLFVTAMFMVTAYAVRRIHPAVVLPVAFLLGCVCGYSDYIDDTLYMSRYLVFLPVYLAGYYLTPQAVISFTSKMYVKCVVYFSMLLYFVMCFRNIDIIYKLRKLYTGRNPFSAIPIDNCGAQYRLLCYLISALMCTAVIAIIPNIKIPLITHMGSNTLGVYFWHNVLLSLLKATPFFTLIMSTGDPMYKVLLLASPVVMCFILSFDIFSYPLSLLSKLINRLDKKWCCVLIAAPFVIGAAVMYKDVIAECKYLFSKAKHLIGY